MSSNARSATVWTPSSAGSNSGAPGFSSSFMPCLLYAGVLYANVWRRPSDVALVEHVEKRAPRIVGNLRPDRRWIGPGERAVAKRGVRVRSLPLGGDRLACLDAVRLDRGRLDLPDRLLAGREDEEPRRLAEFGRDARERRRNPVLLDVQELEKARVPGRAVVVSEDEEVHAVLEVLSPHGRRDAELRREPLRRLDRGVGVGH